MDKQRRIHGEGGGGATGGGNQTVIVQQPIYNPVYTPDYAGLQSRSFAQLQLLLCEGEIQGPAYGNTVDGLEKSVYLDDTPIRIGDKVVPKPHDLVLSWGRPASQQTGVPGFNRIGSVFAVDKTVKYGLPISQSITNPDQASTVYGRVILTFEALVVSNTKGDVYATSVGVTITTEDAAGVTRTVVNGAVEGKFSGTFQKEYEFRLEGQSPWRVTVTRNTPDDQARSDGTTVYRSAFNFSTVVTLLDQRLSYPHSAVLSLGISADQYSAMPAVSVELLGRILQVPSNYDPIARTYNGLWDGTFKRAYSNNPAWVMYDLVTNSRFGLGAYVEAWQVDKWSLYAIGRYCDEAVPAANGGTEPRLTCNIILQTAEQAWTVLQQMSSIFRGMLYYAGGYVVAIQDKPGDPVFTFNESNTIGQVDGDGNVSAGNFSYAGAAKRARHTVVLASWDDPADNYQPRVEYIADEEGVSRYGYKPLDLRLMGVTSRGQALRAANMALLSEAVLDDTVSFATNEIAAAVRPGDRIKIADPNKLATRYGGRIVAVSGSEITLDDSPSPPPGGWAGATFSFMANGADNQPTLISAAIETVAGNQVRIGATPQPPVETFAWLIEAPNRTAQDFRVLTVEEQAGGVYAVTALRYRADLFAAVDFDTPLNDNEDYLFKQVNPGTPTITAARVIWDNGQAKVDVEWKPASTNAVLTGFDLSVKEYRLQYQAGSLQPDGSILYDGVWREVLRQQDNREQISLNQFVSTDRFKVRVCAVSRIGAESPWAERDADDIQVGSPMPDLGGTHLGGGQFPSLLPNATLTHLNQSSGAQLFSWTIAVPLPAYVTGVLLEGKPNRPLTDVEAAGLNPPTADGWYAIGDVPTANYYALAFHALVNWTVRISLITAIPGITGTSYATDTVDRAELVPPAPVQFVVVTQSVKPSTPLTRRFSWEHLSPVPFAEKWPLGVVTDIVAFDIRFKAGTTADWDLGFPLYSDGIPGHQRWFETTLFDSGQWTVMIRSRDRTGWLSDDMAFIKVNLGDALPTNVVDRIDLKPWAFPGTLTNATRVNRVSGLMYPAPLTTAFYLNPQDDEFYEGAAGHNIVQTDASTPAVYVYPLTITESNVGLVVYTQSSGTYQWFLRKVGGAGLDLIYPQPTGDVFYKDPRSGYFYREVTTGLTLDFHPLAPFEQVDAGTYELAVQFHSVDGSKPAEIWDVDIVLDYPDIVETFNDKVIPVGGKRLALTHPFQVLKAVNLTLQDTPAPGVAAVARVSGKDRTGFTVRCYDTAGNDVEGLVDATCVGY